MIRINLLPIELRRVKKKLDLSKMPLVQLAVTFILLLTFLSIIMGLNIIVKKISLKNLNKQWEQISQKRQEAEALKKETADLTRRLNAFRQLKEKEFLWAQKLNQLSDSIMPGVWLTQFSLEETTSTAGTSGYVSTPAKASRVCLVLKGSAAIPGGNETILISKFMQNLRDNKEFFICFQDMRLISIERRTIKNTGVMDFVLVLYFKEGVFLF